MKNHKHLILIFFLLLQFPLTLLSQSKLHYIDKPSVAKPYKSVKAVVLLADHDEVIGKFTDEFVNNVASAFEAKGIEVQKNLIYSDIDPDITVQRLDSIIQNYNPEGIILLSVIGSGIMKAQTIGNLRPCLVFDFQYSYRGDGTDSYVHMFMTHISIDSQKLDLAEPFASEELLKKMVKKKVL